MCIEGHLTGMEFRPAKRENPVKKMEAGGVQIELEVAFAKAKKDEYDHGDGSAYNSDNDYGDLMFVESPLKATMLNHPS